MQIGSIRLPPKSLILKMIMTNTVTLSLNLASTITAIATLRQIWSDSIMSLDAEVLQKAQTLSMSSLLYLEEEYLFCASVTDSLIRWVSRYEHVSTRLLLHACHHHRLSYIYEFFSASEPLVKEVVGEVLWTVLGSEKYMLKGNNVYRIIRFA